MVLPEVKSALMEYSKKYNVPIYDAFGGLVTILEKELKSLPLNQPGLRLKTNEAYFNRMDSIHYAIKYDDGQTLTGIEKADVILIGLSSTGKTPCSMYLAQHYGLKVANIPISLGILPPEILYKINSNKIFGLTCDPLVLQSFRNTKMNLDYSPDYCNLDHISREIEYANKLFNELKCQTLNMTNRAIEETANEIIFNLKLAKI